MEALKNQFKYNCIKSHDFFGIWYDEYEYSVQFQFTFSGYTYNWSGEERYLYRYLRDVLVDIYEKIDNKFKFSDNAEWYIWGCIQQEFNYNWETHLLSVLDRMYQCLPLNQRLSSYMIKAISGKVQ